VLARALEPFPSPVRTRDALHLATLQFLASERQPVALATFDERMRRAEALGLSLTRL
jgi:predicted nucleic acid-binding protein